MDKEELIEFIDTIFDQFEDQIKPVALRVFTDQEFSADDWAPTGEPNDIKIDEALVLGHKRSRKENQDTQRVMQEVFIKFGNFPENGEVTDDSFFIIKGEEWSIIEYENIESQDVAFRFIIGKQ